MIHFLPKKVLIRIFFFNYYFYYVLSWHQEMNNDKEAKTPNIYKNIANYCVSSGGFMLSKEIYFGANSSFQIYLYGGMDHL